MRKRLTLLLSVLVLGVLVLFSCQQMTNPTDSTESDAPATQVENGTPIEGQYIVVLNQKALPQGLGKAAAIEATTEKIRAEYNIAEDAIQRQYSHALAGFAGKLDDSQRLALSEDNRVDYIEQDKLMVLGKPPWAGGGGNDGGGNSPSQTTPWGITRVGGATASSGTAWIIDTGIDLDHPDLNVDAGRSVTMISKGKDSKSADDGNGHGTHVAGTIAALDNDRDVVGVAAGAAVVAVKVLDHRGSGSYSEVIAGVDYVAANASAGDVANMSLGGPTSQALDDAVLAAADNGVKFSLAAGNESDDANNSSPARVNHSNVYTVSAFAEGDTWASFSNYGNPPVDYSAPGVDIQSLWLDGGMNTIGGTSMAAPHVAGLLLVTGGNLTSDGTVAGDPDGDPDPIAHN